MGTDYRPNPQHTQAGHPPKPGQFSKYVDADGDIYQCVITWVGETFGNYVAVGAIKIRPGAKALRDNPGQLGNPVSTERDGWTFNIEQNCVTWCPCPPPLPAHPCP